MKEREGGWGRPCEEREKKKKEINKNEKSVMMQVLTFFVVLCCLLCGDLVVIITCHGDVCACFMFFIFYFRRGARYSRSLVLHSRYKIWFDFCYCWCFLSSDTMLLTVLWWWHDRVTLHSCTIQLVIFYLDAFQRASFQITLSEANLNYY